mgnify:CR=1 FL=1
MKKIICAAMTAVMVLLMMSVSVSAAEIDSSDVGADSNSSVGADTSSAGSGSSSSINFDSGSWKNFTTVYCHIWKRGGDPVYTWQSKKEKCTGSGQNWSYDISKITMNPSDDYCVIFSTNIGQQTYDATFSKACIGDTLKLTGNKIENPKDSEKKADEAVWTKNSSNYGPHLAFTSIGNIVGSKLCPNEKGTEVIGDWLPTYYKSQYVEPVPALVKAYKKFGITSASQIQDIYAYILNKKTGEDEPAMKKMLEDAFSKAYPNKPKVKINEKKAKDEAKNIADNGGHISTSKTTTSSNPSYTSTVSTDSSGSGADGQEDVILFVLAAVMLASGACMFITRRKRTE